MKVVQPNASEGGRDNYVFPSILWKKLEKYLYYIANNIKLDIFFFFLERITLDILQVVKSYIRKYSFRRRKRILFKSLHSEIP